MSHQASTVGKRVALSLACGTIFTAVLGASLYFNSVARRQPLQVPRRVDEAGTPTELLNSAQDADDELKSGHLERAAACRPAEPNAHDQSRAQETAKALAQGRDQGHTRRGDTSDDELFRAFERLERRMAAGMARARESVVSLEYTATEGTAGLRRIATGVVINSRGDVVSVRIDPPSAPSASQAASSSVGVTRSEAGIVARDASGRRHLASWVAVDPETGLTLLQIAPRAVRPIEMAGEEVTLGSQVFVVGNPFGLGHSVSRGHIAGLGRALKLGSRQLGGLIQVQATFYPGDSGAVVANLRGQLLGLIRSGLAVPSPGAGRTERDNDFGFAITVRDVLWVADQLRARGRVDRAYLGVRLEPAAEPAIPWQQSEPAGALPAQTANSVEGAQLQEVLAGSPAAMAGLQAGDAIVALDGQPVRSPHDLTDCLDRLPAQSSVRLDVLRGHGRGAKRFSMALQTSGRPESATPAAASPSAPASVPAASTGSRGEPGAGHPSLSFVPTAAGTSPPNTLPQPGAESRAIPGAPAQTQAGGANPPATVASTAARAEAPASNTTPAALADPDPKLGQPKLPLTDAGSTAPVPSPKPVQSSPHAALPQPQPDDLKLTIPQAVTERLDQLERRLEKLEHAPTSPPEARQTSSMRTP